MKLNYKKWRESYDIAIAGQQNARDERERSYYTTMITWLLSVRAHIKGKVHRQRARLVWSEAWRWGKLSYEDASAIAANGGSLVMATNARDQSLYIGDSWKDFVVEDDHSAQHKSFTQPSKPATPPPFVLHFPTEPSGRVRRAVNKVLDLLGL